MGFDPTDAINAARDIATNAIKKAADIVEDAGHVLGGDVVEGATAIVQDSLAIPAYAVERAIKVVTGSDDAASEVSG
jgi:hypothetical protein